MLPSVRGRQRTVAGAILIASGTAAGAIAGLMLALVAAVIVATTRFPLGSPGGGTIAALITVGATLDGLRMVIGRPNPPTAGRQVPSEWARLFPAEVTAMLYGARLGVGPLTILSTWTWWSFTVASAVLGPGSAIATGATFGLVKLSLVAAVSRAADGPAGHATVFGQLRSGQRPSWTAITLLSLALAVAASGCGRPEADEVAVNKTTPTSELIEPVELEDIVRPDTAELTTDSPREIDTELAAAMATNAGSVVATSPDARASSPVGASPESDAESATDDRPTLGSDLLDAIDGYQTIEGPEADRFLDLQAAAGIQPDPTEEVALLETRGYRGGWLRAFRNQHNDVAVASVYEFRDEVEAEFYLEDGLITIGGYGGKFFDIPDLPGVRGFAQNLNQSDGEATEELVSLGASFHQGDRWYLLYFLGSPERVTPEILIPAITAQLSTVSLA